MSLGAAAWLGPAVLGVDALGVAAGASYDLALKRTPLAVLAWWPGFLVVPLIGMVATGRLHGALAAVPLAGLLALAVHLANGLPDIEGDRRGGADTLPAVLGADAVALGDGAHPGLGRASTSRRCAGRSARAVWRSPPPGCSPPRRCVPLLPRGAPRLAFPLLAVLAAGATVSWLAALPPAAPGVNTARSASLKSAKVTWRSGVPSAASAARASSTAMGAASSIGNP